MAFFCQGYMTPLYPNTSITSNLSRACCAMTVVSCQAFSTKRRLVETSKPCRRIHTVCGFLSAPKLDGVYIMRCKYQIGSNMNKIGKNWDLTWFNHQTCELNIRKMDKNGKTINQLDLYNHQSKTVNWLSTNRDLNGTSRCSLMFWYWN